MLAFYQLPFESHILIRCTAAVQSNGKVDLERKKKFYDDLYFI